MQYPQEFRPHDVSKKSGVAIYLEPTSGGAPMVERARIMGRVFVRLLQEGYSPYTVNHKHYTMFAPVPEGDSDVIAAEVRRVIGNHRIPVNVAPFHVGG